MKMEYHHISSVYDKLTNYSSNINIAGMLSIYFRKYSKELQESLYYKIERDEIANIFKLAYSYTNIRKTLYIATDQVLNLDVDQHLTMIKPNIYRYKDMKMAIRKYKYQQLISSEKYKILKKKCDSGKCTSKETLELMIMEQG